MKPTAPAAQSQRAAVQPWRRPRPTFAVATKTDVRQDIDNRCAAQSVETAKISRNSNSWVLGTWSIAREKPRNHNKSSVATSWLLQNPKRALERRPTLTGNIEVHVQRHQMYTYGVPIQIAATHGKRRSAESGTVSPKLKAPSSATAMKTHGTHLL